MAMRTKGFDLFNTWLAVALVVLNLLVANALLSRWGSARVDLTENKEHSLSPVTQKILRELPDRVEILGLFSMQTHRLLKPLIPAIHDLLEEYEMASDGKVVVKFYDPYGNEKEQDRLYQEFGVKPTPLRLETRYSEEVRSAYFDIVVRMGDQNIKYSLMDLVDVSEEGGQMVVKLKNLEDLLTTAIRKVSTSFATIDGALLTINSPVKVQLSVLPGSKMSMIPKEVAAKVNDAEKVLKEIIEKHASGAAKGKITYSRTESQDPMKVFWVSVSYGSRSTSFPLFMGTDDLKSGVSKADIKERLESAFKRVLPGFVKTIGLVTPRSVPKFNPMMAPPPDEFQMLSQMLGEEYNVKHVDLSKGRAPVDVELLIVARPEKLSDKELYAIDQYVMMGGRLVLLLDPEKLDYQALNGPAPRMMLKEVNANIDKLLDKWGVVYGDSLVLDSQFLPYPLPVSTASGMIFIEQVPYPYFVRATSFADDPVVRGLQQLVFLWPGYLKVKQMKGIQATQLVKTSPKAWTKEIAGQLDVTPHRGESPTPPSGAQSYALAVLLRGKFESAFKGEPSPVATKDGTATKDSTATQPAGEARRDESPDNTRIAIVADSDFVSKLGLDLLDNQGMANLVFFRNLLDWVQAQDDMLQTRSKGPMPRPLRDIPDDTKGRIQTVFWMSELGLLALLYGLIAAIRRSRSRSFADRRAK